MYLGEDCLIQTEAQVVKLQSDCCFLTTQAPNEYVIFSAIWLFPYHLNIHFTGSSISKCNLRQPSLLECMCSKTFQENFHTFCWDKVCRDGCRSFSYLAVQIGNVFFERICKSILDDSDFLGLPEAMYSTSRLNLRRRIDTRFHQIDTRGCGQSGSDSARTERNYKSLRP